ncbi:MAG TPA: ATP phosphoribosyltransferase regulatory subunit [Rhodobacterales bacterium]|nr:ATP phosphoribosyltransferase regulatory subunit [Rhodobacterales bacterium]
MTEAAAIRLEAARLVEFFEHRGARRVDPPVLQPARTLLDLYGEDIRARAYVTADPVLGEAMLRPDFTVPVVRMHMEKGAGAARYTYAGEVFRKPEGASHRPPEHVQVGFEVFDGAAPAEADAEVFAAISQALEPLGLRAATGDIGLLLAAVKGLSTTDLRKKALLRHLWRPRRFRALLDRFAGRTPPPQGRAELLASPDPMACDAPLVGLRSAGEIEARIEALRADAKAPPIPAAEVALLDDLLGLRETVSNITEHLRDLAVDMPGIAPAVERFAARGQALAARGVDIDRLDFEGSYGRTALEYYDGFVFGLYAEGRPDLPPVATGGRYDALTRVLGEGREMPAVGGVIRPGLALDLGQDLGQEVRP